MTAEPHIERRSSFKLNPRYGIGLGLLAFSLIWFLLPVESWLTSLALFVGGHPVSGPIVFGVAYIATSLVLMPSTILTLAAGSIWGWWWGALWLHFVSIIADTLMFLIAKRGMSRVATDRHSVLLSKLDRAFEKDGFVLAVLIRWFPILPTNVVNYLLGTTSLSLRDYFWATTLGTIPNTFLFVYLGALATPQSRATISSEPLVIGSGLLFATLSMVGLMFYAKHTIARRHGGLVAAPEKTNALRDAVYDDLYDVPCAVWNRQESLFLGRAYLGAIASCDPSIVWRYVVLTDGDDVIGFMPMQSFEVRPQEHVRSLSAQDATSASNRLTRALVVSILNRFNRRVLTIGNCFSSGVPSWWIAPSISETDAQSRFLEIANAQARSLDAGTLMLKDVSVPIDGRVATDNGYRSHDVDPVMELSLSANWKSIDDYLDALKSRYRTTFRKVRASSSHITRRRMSPDEIARYQDRIETLHQTVLQKAGFCPVSFGPTAFEIQKRALGDAYHVVGYFSGQQLLGFNTQYVTENVLYSHFFGVDPDAAVEHELLRNIMLDDIEDAIDSGCRRVHFGRCAHSMKSAFGAQPTGALSWFKHRHRLARWIFTLSLRFVEAPTWPVRHPFKKNAHVG